METQLKSYLLESGNGKGFVEVRSVEQETLLILKSKFYLNDSNELESTGSFTLPLEQSFFLEIFCEALSKIRQNILNNEQSEFKYNLIENALSLTLLDGSFWKAIGKRWCSIALEASPKVEMKFVIQLDVTVIDSFLERCENSEKGSE